VAKVRSESSVRGDSRLTTGRPGSLSTFAYPHSTTKCCSREVKMGRNLRPHGSSRLVLMRLLQRKAIMGDRLARSSLLSLTAFHSAGTWIPRWVSFNMRSPMPPSRARFQSTKLGLQLISACCGSPACSPSKRCINSNLRQFRLRGISLTDLRLRQTAV